MYAVDRVRNPSGEASLVRANGDVGRTEPAESGVAFELGPIEFLENLGCDRREERFSLV